MWIFDQITRRLETQTEELRAIRAGQERIEALLRWIVRPPRPGSIREVLLREESDMLVYQAALPALPDPIGDIVAQRFSASADGVEVLTQEFGTDVTVSPEFSVTEGQAVVLTLAYIDDAGNVSSPSTQEFVAADTIPPAAPGAFGEVTLLREE